MIQDYTKEMGCTCRIATWGYYYSIGSQVALNPVVQRFEPLINPQVATNQKSSREQFMGL